MTAKTSVLTREEFVARAGHVFEHSPWVAESAWDRGLVTDAQSADGVHRALCAAFRSAPRERRLEVLRAHPDLAGRLAVAGGLSPLSTKEQAAAGLDQCRPAELKRFQALNATYQQRFDFPFIIAVQGKSRDEILKAFETRIDHLPEHEFDTACAEVEQIARLRLEDMDW